MIFIGGPANGRRLPWPATQNSVVAGAARVVGASGVPLVQEALGEEGVYNRHYIQVEKDMVVQFAVWWRMSPLEAVAQVFGSYYGGPQ